jgi:hypothetical protein
MKLKRTFCIKTMLALAFAVLVLAAPAFAQPWKFGVLSDTQWKNSYDNKNPNGCAVNVIRHINQEFIDKGVKFVIQVGDLTDNGKTYNVQLDTAATFMQPLYNAGIGFYPIRGNHEDSKNAAIEFQRIFPQTLTGVNNQTPADAMVNTTVYGPQFSNHTTFTVGSNFSSSSADFAGLTYSFDYNNARFVLLDQFTPPSGTAHSVLDSNQVAWAGARLSSPDRPQHAFVIGHKHLISENHADTLFGDNPSANPAGLQDAFMANLSNNGVRYYMGGHDHMHNRAIVTSPDGASKVQNIIAASDAYKFYIPQFPSNDEKYNIPANGIYNGPREMEINQELFTIGYYIVTVDGPKVTVDYYGSPNGCNGDCDLSADLIPYTFTKHETFGYSLNGKEFLVPEGQPYTDVQDSFGSTSARIFSGKNNSTAAAYDGRPFTKAVDTGWTNRTGGTSSDILTLWGMTDAMGSDQTDTYALAMNYNFKNGNPPTHLGDGLFGLATKDADGNWVNAVDKNIGGTKKFVFGAWDPSYGLGTYGFDPCTHTAWAVVNYNGDFAVAGFNN